MPLHAIDELERLLIDAWSTDRVSAILEAKRLERLSEGRVFNYVVAGTDTNRLLKPNVNIEEDEFAHLIHQIGRILPVFNGRLEFQMAVSTQNPHWTAFSCLIEKNKLHFFCLDAAEDPAGLVELEYIIRTLGPENCVKNYIFLNKTDSGENDPHSGKIQTSNRGCSRTTVEHIFLLSAADIFRKLEGETFESLPREDADDFAYLQLPQQDKLEAVSHHILAVPLRKLVKIHTPLVRIMQSWTRLRRQDPYFREMNVSPGKAFNLESYAGWHSELGLDKDDRTKRKWFNNAMFYKGFRQAAKIQGVELSAKITAAAQFMRLFEWSRIHRELTQPGFGFIIRNILYDHLENLRIQIQTYTRQCLLLKLAKANAQPINFSETFSKAKDSLKPVHIGLIEQQLQAEIMQLCHFYMLFNEEPNERADLANQKREFLLLEYQHLSYGRVKAKREEMKLHLQHTRQELALLELFVHEFPVDEAGVVPYIIQHQDNLSVSVREQIGHISQKFAPLPPGGNPRFAPT